MKNGRLKVLWLFLAVSLFYSAWMTGFKFSFPECDTLPNYNMLASAFAHGRLFIENTPPLDTILKDERRYIFSGPVPALMRMPLMLISGMGIPSGFMIAVLCAGIVVFFTMTLEQLTPLADAPAVSFIRKMFSVVFVLNGISLFMVTIPSLHHESICSAMFFLTMSIYLLFKIKNNGYRASIKESTMMGIALSLSIGSRFSYVYAATVVGGILLIGMLRNTDRISRWEITRGLVIIAGIGMVTLGLMLCYNYARFGAFLDFGMKYLISLYQNYFANGGYFRYDHFPYNFWSLFFRIPQVGGDFPFLIFPSYILQVQSIGITSYFLLNTNELTVSIFCLLPVTILFVVPLFTRRSATGAGFENYIIFSAIFLTQIFSITFTIATIARYYYDFFPIMMMMTYMGAVWLKVNRKVSDVTLISMGVISVVISFALPMNAIQFYDPFIDYRSPLLNIFF